MICFKGLISIGLISALAFVRNLLNAFESREHEQEADLLGIKIAAMACFDTRKGSEVFRRLYENESENGTVGILSSYLASHPPTDERFEFLRDASTHENALKYMDSFCAPKINSTWYECIRKFV